METLEEQKVHFRWSREDEENLKRLKDFGEKYKDEFTNRLYTYLANFPDFKKYLPTEKIMEKHQEQLKDWFVSLFDGDYGASHLSKLYKIGEAHVKIGLPPHYVNTAMNFKREFIREKLIEEFGYTEELERLMKSVDKIIDLNLDIMTGSYREEELKYYLARGKLQRKLVENIRRVSHFFEIFIVIALVLAGMLLIFSVIYEGFYRFSSHCSRQKSSADLSNSGKNIRCFCYRISSAGTGSGLLGDLQGRKRKNQITLINVQSTGKVHHNHQLHPLRINLNLT